MTELLCDPTAQLTRRGCSLVGHRKICKSCKCSQEEHSLSSELEDDRKIGRLLSDSKYSTLTARLKGGDGVRIYKRNRMIVTNPNISGKDPTFDTITYEWAPPGLAQKLVRRGAGWGAGWGHLLGNRTWLWNEVVGKSSKSWFASESRNVRSTVCFGKLCK